MSAGYNRSLHKASTDSVHISTANDDLWWHDDGVVLLWQKTPVDKICCMHKRRAGCKPDSVNWLTSDHALVCDFVCELLGYRDIKGYNSVIILRTYSRNRRGLGSPIVWVGLGWIGLYWILLDILLVRSGQKLVIVIVSKTINYCQNMLRDILRNVSVVYITSRIVRG